MPWRLSPANPPPASAEPADSEFFLRLELETFLRLVAPVSGFGSSSSSSLLVSFSQAGTALVDLSLKTRPELCGLDAAPFMSVNEAETPDLGRPAPRSLSPLRGVTIVLVAGVGSAALSSAGSSSLSTPPVRSPAASITVRTLQPTSNYAWSQEGLVAIWGKTDHIWLKDVLIASGLYPTVGHFLWLRWVRRKINAYIYWLETENFS